MRNFSDYIVYVDESGDHNLVNVNPDFPVFCLSFCVVTKERYLSKIVPAFQKFKFDFWGHDLVVLHEHEIRKSKNLFSFLMESKEVRQNFFRALNDLVEDSDISVFAAVIQKDRLKNKYAYPDNPYNIAMLFCMEKLRDFLVQNNQKNKKISVVFESRGKKEDNDLEIEFRRICDNERNWAYKNTDFKEFDFEPIFAPKAVNSTGLQLADLVARPVALSVIKPGQPNRAYEIIKEKLSLKIFP
ncbi:MAG TPA: DUF3800 domain-containing protein [Hellea balneolensis]|uniref:DUF3800 domain-containing protein n=1 Tax=Hellea balneolensis TaxID=287478 RepID=A0A7C5LZ72_9PROT|nr:DUF3800 domain-containing protein [Hellea balneolensis]